MVLALCIADCIAPCNGAATIYRCNDSVAYPHGRVQGSSNFVILLQSRAATQDLRKPELAHSTFHVANLALFGSRCLDPLGGLTANTADHVCMSESFGSPLGGLHVESGWNWLSDARVERRRATGDDQRIFPLAACRRPIPRGWPDER